MAEENKNTQPAPTPPPQPAEFKEYIEETTGTLSEIKSQFAELYADITNSKFTDKEQLFIVYYLKFTEKTKAAIAAGYSEKNAGVIGYQVYNKPHVKAVINKYLSAQISDALETKAKIEKFTNGSLENFISVDETGRYRIDLLKAKRLGVFETLKKLKEGKFGIELEVHSPLDALKMSGQTKGLFIEKVVVTDPAGESPLSIFKKFVDENKNKKQKKSKKKK